MTTTYETDIATEESATDDVAESLQWARDAVAGIASAADASSAFIKLEDGIRFLGAAEDRMQSFLESSLQRGTEAARNASTQIASVRELMLGRGERAIESAEAKMGVVFSKLMDLGHRSLITAFNRMGDSGIPVAESPGAVNAVLAAAPHEAIEALEAYVPSPIPAEETAYLPTSPESFIPGSPADGEDVAAPVTVADVVLAARAAASRLPLGSSPYTPPMTDDGNCYDIMSEEEVVQAIGMPLFNPLTGAQNTPFSEGFFGAYYRAIANGFELTGSQVTDLGNGRFELSMTLVHPLTGVTIGISLSAANGAWCEQHPGCYRPDNTPSFVPNGLFFTLDGHTWSGTRMVPCLDGGNPQTVPPPPPPTVPTSPPGQPVPIPDPTCCPAPDPIREDFDPKKPIHSLGWDPEKWGSWCVEINRLAGAVTGPDTEPTTNPDGSPVQESNPWYAELEKDSKGNIKTRVLPTFVAWAGSPVAGSMTEADLNKLGFNQELLKAAMKDLKVGTQPGGAKLAALLATLGMGGWAETVTGAPVKYLMQGVEYTLRYLAPRLIPDQSAVDSMWLADLIPIDEWECLTRSHGNLPGLHSKAMNAKTARLNIGENVNAYYRGLIDRDGLDNQLRKLGVRDMAETEKWIELFKPLPQLPDVIRFMVRDVENVQAVQDGQLDAEFTQNWKGQLKAWAVQQGISDDVALAYWRAHWELPSPTMAYEFLHRLRPGRVDPSLVTTKDQVSRLLATADYAPGWRDRMMAVSYLTPTRTDIKQGYSLGVYKRDEVIEALQDTGLDKKGADLVARLYDEEKQRRQRAIGEKNSAWTVKETLSTFVEGLLTEDEARTVLELLGLSKENRDSAISSALLKRVTRERAACSKGVRRRFFVGAIDGITAVKELGNNGWDIDAARDIVDTWACERAAGLQEVPARKNVDWAVSGVITLQQLEQRLTNLRYSPDDVARFVGEAIYRIRKAAAAAAEKALREQIADARRRYADYQKRLKEIQKAIKDGRKELCDTPEKE